MPTKKLAKGCLHMRLSLGGSRLGPCIRCGAPYTRARGKKGVTRFRPFLSYQPDPRALADAGLSHLQQSRAKGGGTAFTSESQLNRYLASEKAHGREVAWKQH